MASQVFVPAEFFVSGKLGFICRMYSKEEAYQIRKKFWTSFGQYMKMHLSSEGLAVNWINYKTGIKDLYFKTDVDNKSAKIVIEMTQKDVGLQSLVFE